MKKYKLTEDQYHEMRNDSQGICTACGAVRECTEPDAHAYKCEECGKKSVEGIENLLLDGSVEIVDEPDDECGFFF